jgi:WD40 repeat protein
VTSHLSGHAVVLDAETGEEILRLPGHEGHLWGARYSPDGSAIVTTGWDSIVRVWDAGTGEQLLEIRHQGPDAARSAHYSSDGRFIVTQRLGRNRDVMIWDAVTGRRLCKHPGDWTDGDRIVVVSDTRVKVYRVADLAD